MRRSVMFGIILILATSVLPSCGGKDRQQAQPLAEVSIAFDRDVSNLARLEFKLNHTAGATFNNVPLSSLPGVEIRIFPNYEVVNAINPGGGITTGTAPIMKLTYAVADVVSLPTFSIDSSGTFTATAPDSGPTTPPVTSDNLILSVTYQ